MGQGRTGEWAGFDADMGSEHQKLHQMVASLTAVVANDRSADLSIEAVNILGERLRLHFEIEEQQARKLAPEAQRTLSDDHARLRRQFDRVRGCFATGARSEAEAELRAFVTALNRHDHEIDLPLFRKMAAPTVA